VAKSKSTAKTSRKRSETAKAKSGTDKVQVDRRKSDRRSEDRRKRDEPVAVERRKLERRKKVNRRRQIDPTTCERDYSADEIEFMGALDEYKRKSGRMFPTCSEILEVIRDIGYRKVDPSELQAEEKPVESPEDRSEEADSQ